MFNKKAGAKILKFHYSKKEIHREGFQFQLVLEHWSTGVLEYWSNAFILSLRVTDYELRIMYCRV